MVASGAEVVRRRQICATNLMSFYMLHFSIDLSKRFQKYCASNHCNLGPVILRIFVISYPISFNKALNQASLLACFL